MKECPEILEQKARRLIDANLATAARRQKS